MRIKTLIDVIAGSAFLICGTMLVFLFKPIGYLVQILALLMLFDVISFYDVRKKVNSKAWKEENKTE